MGLTMEEGGTREFDLAPFQKTKSVHLSRCDVRVRFERKTLWPVRSEICGLPDASDVFQELF